MAAPAAPGAAASPALQNVRVRALYDYVARNGNELGFKKGQIIFLYTSDDDGWASGELHGATGWFPSSYVTPDTAIIDIAAIQRQDSNTPVRLVAPSLLRSRCAALEHTSADRWLARPGDEADDASRGMCPLYF
jgi:hypothetical protein